MVEVILLEKIRNLGNLGDKVTVAGGYGRNYLLPSGKALPATKRNLADFEARRAELEQASADKLTVAQAKQAKLVELGTVTIKAQAADEGKLYGSIGPREVAEAITAAGVAVGKSEVAMPLGPIREVSETTLELHLHTDVSAEISIHVIAADA